MNSWCVFQLIVFVTAVEQLLLEFKILERTYLNFSELLFVVVWDSLQACDLWMQ